MKKLFLLLLLVSCLGHSADVVFNALSEAKLKRTAGKVFLSGKYHASGRFKCDDNFLSGGRIYFTLGSDDYSYTLMDVLGHPDLLRKNTTVRGLASEAKAPAWEASSSPYLQGKRITLLPKEKDFPVKKIYISLDENRVMESLYLDFGTHNLSFFAY